MSDRPKTILSFVQGSAQPMRSGAPIEIIIGIDYGTRFTKVAVGHEGQEPSVWKGSSTGPLIPSIVRITEGGDVLPWPEGAPAEAAKIEYLKMLLAKPHDSIFELRASIVGEQRRENVIKALAALFLSEIIRRVRKSEQEKPHLRNATIRWLVNVGVPVEHFDAPEREVFREVACVALMWADAPPPDFKVAALGRAYCEAADAIDRDGSPASVFPELAAALSEYIRDPNRPEGLYYGFCDIGGGTIDGAIFRLHRTSGVPRLAILSASVAPYGTAAVAQAVIAKLNGDLAADRALALSAHIEGLLTDNQASSVAPHDLAMRVLRKNEAEPRTKVQNFLRGFVNEARLKRNVNGHTFADPFTGQPIELRFFLAGGGAESGWVQGGPQPRSEGESGVLRREKIAARNRETVRRVSRHRVPEVRDCARPQQFAG